MRVPSPRIAAVAAIAVAATVFAACGTGEESDRTVVVGSADDVRGEVLAHIYAGALASVGADVRVEPRIGDRTAYLAALDAAEVDVVPDVTGELLATFDGSSEAVDAEEVFTALNRSLPAGLSVTDYASAEDRQAVAVPPSGPLSDASTIADIASQCGAARLVVSTTGSDAADVLAQTYGCTFGSVTEVESESVVPTLLDGSADVAVVRTATAGPDAKDLVVLDDEAGAFRAQNVVPVFRDGVLSEGEIRSFSVVAGELTTADLADMIGEVRSGEQSGDVAARWLGEHDL